MLYSFIYHCIASILHCFFSSERFTEQVSPLLVYAQRQLLERIQQFSGPDSHESHFTKYLSDDAQKVKHRLLFGVLTLNVN